MRTGVALIFALALAASSSAAQQPTLDLAAQAVKRGWLAHDPATILGGSSELLLQLPSADPVPAVKRPQAIALLRSFLAGTAEIAVDVSAAKELEAGRGYVELRRQFRSAGTQEVRRERILLGYRRGVGGWHLTELRSAN